MTADRKDEKIVDEAVELEEGALGGVSGGVGYLKIPDIDGESRLVADTSFKIGETAFKLDKAVFKF